MHQRVKAYSGIFITIAVFLLLALGLSIFRDYLGTRLSGIPLSQSVVGGALKSEGLTIGSHTLEFRGRTRDGKALTNQVSFAVQAPSGGGPGPGDDGSEVKVARLKFRFDPAFLNDAPEAELRQRLVRYVDDINSVYAQNTVRRFVYDPATDFEIWRDFPLQPQSSCTIPLPQGYGFVAYITKTPQHSHSASRFCSNLPGAELAVSDNWHAIWSADDLARNDRLAGDSTTSREDYYSLQLNGIIHELGHNHGIPFGVEYYSIASLTDNSGVVPDLDVSAFFSGTSPYWSDRQVVLTDPMFGQMPDLQSLEGVRFSALSAEIINRAAKRQITPDCFNGEWPCLWLPSQDRQPITVVVEAVDARTGATLSGCSVQMYGVELSGKLIESSRAPVTTGLTTAAGTAAMVWGGSVDIRGDATNAARLFKVQCDGYQPTGAWLSVFDLQAGRIVPEGGAVGDFHYPGKLTIKLQPR